MTQQYQVLARKYRPKNFHELVGQAHVSQALINAIDYNRLHHAYLFTGTRGVGKTTIARILAKCLNCETGITSKPCGVCNHCISIDEGRFIDLIEIDAASRTKVEDTRELIDNVPYAPTQGRYKVYLIDEVHMLSTHSFNALLKTLEEPPEHVKFLLATTDPQKLPITITSRCLQFVLRPLPQQAISDHLGFILSNEKVGYTEPALWQLANAAKGSVRDALSLTDQAIAFGQGQLTNQTVIDMLGLIDSADLIKLVTDIYQGNTQAVAAHIEQLRAQLVDAGSMFDGLAELLHQLAMTQLLPDVMLNVNEVQDKQIRQLSTQMSADVLQLYYQIIIQGREKIKLANTPLQALEMCLLRLLAFRPLRTHEVSIEPPIDYIEPDDSRDVVTDSHFKPAESKAQHTVDSQTIDNPVVHNLKLGEETLLNDTQPIDNRRVETPSDLYGSLDSESGESNANPLNANPDASLVQYDEALKPTSNTIHSNASDLDRNQSLAESITEDGLISIEDINSQSINSDIANTSESSLMDPFVEDSLLTYGSLLEGTSSPILDKEPLSQNTDSQFQVEGNQHDFESSTQPIEEQSIDELPNLQVESQSEFNLTEITGGNALSKSILINETDSSTALNNDSSDIYVSQQESNDDPRHFLSCAPVDLVGTWSAEKWDYWLQTARQSGELGQDELALARQGIMTGDINGESQFIVPFDTKNMQKIFDHLANRLLNQFGTEASIVVDTSLTENYESLTPHFRQQVRASKAHDYAKQGLTQSPVMKRLLETSNAEITQIKLIDAIND